MYVSDPFASESYRGRQAQMRWEYAQPFAGMKALEGAGWAPRDVQRGSSLGSPYLLCAFIKSPARWSIGQRVTVSFMCWEEYYWGMRHADLF